MQHPDKQTENPSCPPCPSATHSLLMGRALTDDSDFTCARQARSTNAPPYNLQKPKGSPVKVLVPDRIRDLLKIRFKYLASINIFANYKITNSTRPQNLMNAVYSECGINSYFGLTIHMNQKHYFSSCIYLNFLVKSKVLKWNSIKRGFDSKQDKISLFLSQTIKRKSFKKSSSVYRPHFHMYTNNSTEYKELGMWCLQTPSRQATNFTAKCEISL